MSNPINLIDFKSQKTGQLTPRIVIQDLMDNIDQVESVVFVVKRKDDQILAGYSAQDQVISLGLLDLAKDKIIYDMSEQTPD